MAETDQESICSRCSKELDTEGSPKWCKACRAKYRREYEDLKEVKAKKMGFAQGARAMQEALAFRAENMGSGSLTGYEIAHAIRTTDLPEMMG